MNQVVAQDLLVGVAGVDVTIAENGQAALDRLAEQKFDVVLMDVQMPVMDGYEATARIRSLPQYGRLPIIAMTAHALTKDRERCLAAGMNDYVTKPFIPAALFTVLAKWAPQPSIGTPSTNMQESLNPTTRQPQALSGISVEVGMKYCFGRSDIYEKMLRMFLDTRRGTSEEIRVALQSGDMKAAALLAHAIKSNAGTIGAQELSKAALALEAAIDGGENKRWAPLLREYDAALQIVLRGLEVHFGEQ